MSTSTVAAPAGGARSVDWALRVAAGVDAHVTRIQDSLPALAGSPHETISRAVRQVLARPGKGLRIRLTLLAGGFGDPGDPDAAFTRLTDAAVCIELLHVASLVHDDVIDESALRRGRPTLNAELGDKLAVLVGDHLLARAAVVASGLGRGGVASHARAVQDLVAGEVAELESTGGALLDHLETVRLKTATLFTLAVDLAGEVCDVPDRSRRLLRVLAENYGIAFQLLDDLRDLLLVDDGKPVAADLTNGVATLPVLVAARTGSVTPPPLPRDLWEAREAVLGSSGPAWAVRACRARLTDARLALLDLPRNAAGEGLHQVLDDAETALSSLSDGIERLRDEGGRTTRRAGPQAPRLH